MHSSISNSEKSVKLHAIKYAISHEDSSMSCMLHTAPTSKARVYLIATPRHHNPFLKSLFHFPDLFECTVSAKPA